HRLSLLAGNRRPDRAPPRRGPVIPDTTSAAALQIPAAGTYQPARAASPVKFATRHLLGLAAVKGTFRLISGQITIADPLTSSTASAVIDAASFATGN